MSDDDAKKIADELVKAQQKLDELKAKQLEKDRLINKEANSALNYIKEEARLRKEINSSFNSLYRSAKEYKDALITIGKLNKQIKNTEDAIEDLKKDQTKEGIRQLEIEQAKLGLLKEQETKLIKQAALYKDALKNSNKSALVLAKSFSLIGVGFGKMKSLGLFDMDKAMKNAAFSMGLLSKQTDGFRTTITNASKQTASIGVTLQDISKIQEVYSEELGRSVQMNEKSLVAMGQLSKFADLGAEGAARMAAEMDMQGMSAEKTGEFVNQTLNDSHAMGLNASKVIKNIAGNIKMLNKYRFKDGVKGLAKMAMTASKLGVDMSFAGGMADKLFDIEGAVDMSAQLQVMGGAWAQMADPFHLMYMARNDMEGLTEEIANAAKQSMSFAKDGSIETSAMEMQRLRIVAQQTGLEYDQLVDAGKAAFKLSKIKGQIGNVSPELQEFIANTAEFKDGKATIMIGDNPKLLSALTAKDKDILAGQMKQKADMKERAKQALTFDEALTNMVNGLKIYLLPFIDVINKNLLPAFNNLTDKWEKSKWGDKLGKLAESIGNFVVGVGKYIIDIVDMLGPKGVFYTALVGWSALKIATWVANGVALGKGFNMVAKAGMSGGVPGRPAGGYTKNGMPINRAPKGGFSAGKGYGIGSAAGLAGLGLDIANQNEVFGKEGSTGHKVAGIGAKALEYGGTGAMIGTMIAPGIGTAIGGAIGAIGGGIYGAYNEGVFGKEQNDAVFAPRKGLGAEFSKGRGVLENGKITPIPNKERFLSMEPYGPADRAMNQQSNQSSEMKVEHSDIKFNGSINVNIPGTNAVALEIMKTTIFRNEIVRVFNELQEKNNNGGKVAGY